MTLPALEHLLMHRAPMLLLDRARSVSERHASAELTVRADIAFIQPGRGLPAYAGLELMAQTIAIIDGMRCYRDGQPPKIGFLLGCRRYSTACDAFALGARLIVDVDMVFDGGEMYSFDCRIGDGDGAELATATLSVFAPRNPEKFLKDGLT